MGKENAKQKTKVIKKSYFTIIMIALILVSLGGYWFLSRTPDLEGFLADTYSPGETAEFEATVTDRELVNTSYGNATLVYFDDYEIPFCFLSEEGTKYEKGKTYTVEITFHEYNIDGERKVLPKELYLSTYLRFEEVFQGVSHLNGMTLGFVPPDRDPGSFDLTVNTFLYANRTFRINLYDSALMSIRELDEGPGEIGSPDIYTDLKYAKKGTFGYDLLHFNAEEYLKLGESITTGLNCSDLKGNPGYLPDRSILKDSDLDGNLSIGDVFRMRLKPTEDRYTFDLYTFNIGGITGGARIILNWYDGPFYSRDRYAFYTWGPVEETYTGENSSLKLPVHHVVGDALAVDNVMPFISAEDRSPQRVFDEEMYNGIHNRVDLPHSSNRSSFPVVISFRDENMNDLFDGGDHFRIENIKRGYKFEFMIKDDVGNILANGKYAVGLGMDSGRYPLITMENPRQDEKNITFEVDNADAKYVKISECEYSLFVENEEITAFPNHELPGGTTNDGSMRLVFNDSDANGFFNDGDNLEIRNIPPNTEYVLRVTWDTYDHLLFEYNGTAG